MRPVLLLLFYASCHVDSCHVDETRDVALGWKGSVSSLLLPCHPVASHPTNVVPLSATEYEAVALGTEDFACNDDRVHLRVSEAVRLVIDRLPATVKVGDRHFLRVHAEDVSGRKLDIGDDYVDTYGGVIERTPCPGGDDVGCVGTVHATRPGAGTATVTFGSLHETLVITAL